MRRFCEIECGYIERVNVTDAVIATGGSVVYYESAMKHLQASGRIIYMQLPLEELTKRLPQVKNQILMILPNKKVEDIQTVEGKNIAMNEIVTQLNALLKRGKIKHLYFTEFVIQ